MNVDVDLDWFKRHVTVEWNVLDDGEPYLQPWTEDRDEASAYIDDATGPLVCRSRIHYEDVVGRWVEQPVLDGPVVAAEAPQEATGGDLRASEPQDDHPCYSDALRWAADVAHSEARWQWERDLRRITGAQIVAQRAEVLEACYREAADRHDNQASGAESDHGDRREGQGLA